MHYLYILHSKSLNTYYVGESPDPTHRLNQHNTHYFKKNFTKAVSDWALKLKLENAKEGDSEKTLMEKLRVKEKIGLKKAVSNYFLCLIAISLSFSTLNGLLKKPATSL